MSLHPRPIDHRFATDANYWLFPGFGDLGSATAWKPSTFVIKISGYALFHQKLGRAKSS
ncbi:MAG: hypothetical protein HY785_09930 [Oscillatoriophycideae cyanobacterium NC_groundwater_1537_Pr4_S-0.65um_50_18]|nr:hypothetical protein [Oscillatoriophycideae cyanobacterium NC_groundwater_1537_Pr4_S-0.65um_50_18]